MTELGLREQIFTALGGLRDSMTDADVAAVQRFAKMLPGGEEGAMTAQEAGQLYT